MPTPLGAGTTNGDMNYWNGSNWVNLTVGTAGRVLVQNSTPIPAWTASWGLLASSTLGGAAASISLTPLPAFPNLLIVWFVPSLSGSADVYLRFNGDAGGNYAQTDVHSVGGAAPAATQVTAQTQVYLDLVASAFGYQGHLIMNNGTALADKMGAGFRLDQRGTGATALSSSALAAKWTAGSAGTQITRVDILASANNLNTGSFLGVYGA